MNEIDLGPVTVRYRDEGSGPALVFVHGFLVDGTLWRKVVPLLSARFRCIAPTWPFGSHTIATRDADLSPPGCAKIVADFLEALDLDDVTLVGNDSGGAICQIVATEHPKRVGRMVLTNCDAFENFPPSFFKALPPLSKLPGAGWVVAQLFRSRAVQRSPLGFGLLSNQRLPDELLDAWFRPVLTDPAVRRDAIRFTAALDKRHTLRAAGKLGSFDRPVLLAWGADDRRLFPVEYAKRLAAALPNARLELIEGARTFVPEDRPDRLAELIAQFAG